MTSTGSPRAHLPAAALLAALFAATVYPVLLGGRGGTAEAQDQLEYHLPIIETMAAQWPRVDLVHYSSATAFGHHLVLAAVAVAGGDLTAVRVVNSFGGLLLIAVAFVVALRCAPAWTAAILVLPLILCQYVISGSIWISTDNSALALALIAVGGAATLAPTAPRLLRWGGWAALAVLVRQIYAWLAVPIAAAALLRPEREPGGTPAPRRTLLAGALAALLPIAAAAALIALWGGLTPPAFRTLHSAAGPNPAALGFAAALTGALGIFFLPAAARELRPPLWRDARLWGALAVALAVTLLWPTDYRAVYFDDVAGLVVDAQSGEPVEGADAHGRWGGPLWLAVERLPAVAGRSVLLPPLAALGVLVLVALGRGACRAGHGRAVLVLGAAGAAWLAAQSFNAQIFQRYYEPFLLALLAWLAAMSASGERRPRWWLAGPGALALIQLGVLAWGLYRPILVRGEG